MASWQFNSRTLRRRILAGEYVKWIEQHIRRDYIRRIVLATPPWIEPKALREVYARRMPGQVIDHIIPITHPRVCGLHVPWNLAVVPHGTNASKSNRWCQWQGDLFDEQWILTS